MVLRQNEQHQRSDNLVETHHQNRFLDHIHQVEREFFNKKNKEAELVKIIQ